MLRALLLLALLTGCSPKPVVFPFLPGCDDYVALARAVVDGRQRGQSREEQRLLVNEAGRFAGVHRAVVESVYDWPRPTTDRDWRALTTAASSAAEARCVNRPGAALQGRYLS